MKRSRLAIFVSACFAMASLSAQGAGGAAPAGSIPPAATLKVGVVDFVRVVDAYPRAIEERKKVEDLRRQQLTILDGELKQIRELQIKLQDLQRGTSKYDLAQHELRMKQQGIEGMQAVYDRDWRRRVDDFYRSIYRDLERAVAIVAKDRGVQLVLRAHPEPEDASSEDKARVFEARIVWYAAEEIDLTAAVIQLLQVPLPPDPKAAPASPAPSAAGSATADGAKTETAGG